MSRLEEFEKQLRELEDEIERLESLREQLYFRIDEEREKELNA